MPPAAQPKTIYEALLKFQQDPPELVKSATNPHFKNNYVPLEQVVERVFPELNKLGVVVIQAVTALGGETALETTLHHVASGTEITGTVPLILDKMTPQAQGSSISYMRRYAILSTLGLVGEPDDDGEKASTPQVRASRKEGTQPAEFAPSL